MRIKEEALLRGLETPSQVIQVLCIPCPRINCLSCSKGLPKLLVLCRMRLPTINNSQELVISIQELLPPVAVSMIVAMEVCQQLSQREHSALTLMRQEPYTHQQKFRMLNKIL